MKKGIVKKSIYVAGPLFSESERAFDEQIAAVCEKLGHKTFLPHRDAGLEVKGTGGKIFERDLFELSCVDLVVANLDGHDVDAGTAWEIGYAYAKGKSILGIRTDRRVLEPWAAVNLMIGKSTMMCSTLDGLKIAVEKFFHWSGHIEQAIGKRSGRAKK